MSSLPWSWTGAAIGIVVGLLIVAIIFNVFTEDEQWFMVNKNEEGKITVLYMPVNHAAFYDDIEEALEDMRDHLSK